MRFNSCLLLTEGAHGMISQVEGLAKALGINFKHCNVNLKSFWKKIPINFVPVRRGVVSDDLPNLTEPTLLISCGKNSIISSLILKKENPNHFNIHIQNPKIDFLKFDLVVAPEHDQIQGENVISTFGALHYLTKDEILNSSNYFKNIKDGNKIVTLILGGPNRYYEFSNLDLEKIFLQIQKIFLDNNFSLIIIASRRTPPSSIDFAKNYFLDKATIVSEVSKEAYLSSLKISNYLIVTCDSTSMISECAITQKPIFVGMMKPLRANKRFQYFFDSFKAKGITRDLGDKIETWSYTALEETNRVGKIIKERLK